MHDSQAKPPRLTAGFRIIGGSAKTELGRYVQEFLQMDFSGKIMKYETNLQRQLFTVLDELRYLQEHRRSEAEDQDAAPSNAETTSDQ